VILDIHLPIASGLDVLEYIRSNLETKVFVVSSDDLQRNACEMYGIEGWMTKPINVAQFVNAVQYLL
jgi:DNA-binding response OmpR family regulator